MVRSARVEFPGALHHITCRGNERRAIFRDDHDRTRFLRRFDEEAQRWGWHCYAFCLMDNHYHLLLETPEPNLARGMRGLNSWYAQGFNRRHQRVGHLFQGRYHSVLVERDAYLLELCRYIVLNPVRAGMVPDENEWPWSSYRATAGLEPAPRYLDAQLLWPWFGETSSEAQARYRHFVAEGKDARPWDAAHNRRWLGSDAFCRSMEERLQPRISDSAPRYSASVA